MAGISNSCRRDPWERFTTTGWMSITRAMWNLRSLCAGLWKFVGLGTFRVAEEIGLIKKWVYIQRWLCAAGILKNFSMTYNLQNAVNPETDPCSWNSNHITCACYFDNYTVCRAVQLWDIGSLPDVENWRWELQDSELENFLGLILPVNPTLWPDPSLWPAVWGAQRFLNDGHGGAVSDRAYETRLLVFFAIVQQQLDRGYTSGDWASHETDIAVTRHQCILGTSSPWDWQSAIPRTIVSCNRFCEVKEN